MMIIQRYIVPACLWILLWIVSLEDLKERTIKDRWNLLILLISVSHFLLEEVTLRFFLEHLLSALILSLPLFIADLIKPGAFGGGDIKLGFAGGFYLLVTQAFTATMVLYLIAGVISLWKLMRGKKDPIPLGPILSIGIVWSMATGKL